MKKTILERAFGPEPKDDKFRPLNVAKIIPYHDCEWRQEHSHGTVWVYCPVCGAKPPDPPREEI